MFSNFPTHTRWERGLLTSCMPGWAISEAVVPAWGLARATVAPRGWASADLTAFCLISQQCCWDLIIPTLLTGS